VIVFGGVFVLIAGGWLWWLGRPVHGVFAADAGGGGLLVAGGRLLPGREQDVSRFPAALSFFTRMHFAGEKSEVVSVRGIVPSKLKIDIDEALEVAPVAVEGGGMIVARPSGGELARMQLSDGESERSWALEGARIRALAASRDGRRVAWSVSAENRVSNFSGHKARRYPFKLFIADAGLSNVIEIPISEYYPYLIPGSLEWGADGALYFSGFDPADHRQRLTFRADPSSGEVIAAGRDRGILSALSPDGAVAAAVGGGGLRLMECVSGEERVFVLDESFLLRATKPAWSPEAKLVAFVADKRPKTKKGVSPKDAMPKLAVVDAATGDVKAESIPLQGFTCGDCKPVWAPDGGAVFVNGWRFAPRSAGMFVRSRMTVVVDMKSRRTFLPRNAAQAAKFWK